MSRINAETSKNMGKQQTKSFKIKAFLFAQSSPMEGYYCTQYI